MSKQTFYVGKELPKCNICSSRGRMVEAEYDAKVRNGGWAYLCKDHFVVYGMGLGTGKGQKITLKEG